MRKLKLFSRGWVGDASEKGRQNSRPDSLSLVSRQSVLAFLLVLLTTVFGVGNAWGYTITFTTGSGDGTKMQNTVACSSAVSSGTEYLVTNVTSYSNAYYAGGSGLKLGTSSGAGNVKLTLANAVTPTSVVVRAKLYNSGKAATVKINSESTQNLTASFADYTFNITSEISYVQIATSKYAWIESVTVNTSTGNVDVTGVSLNKSTATIEATMQETLVATITPSNATNKNVTWTSDAEAVATVSNGVVTGVAPGTANITVTTADGGFTASCEVTVTEHTVTPGSYDVALNSTTYGVAAQTTIASAVELTKNDITVETWCDEGNKPRIDADYVRYYNGSYMLVSVPAGYEITAMTLLEPSSNKSWGGAVSVDVGTYTEDTKSWSGKAQTVKFSFGATNRCAGVSVTYAAASAPTQCETPVITGTTPFLNSTEVTITCGTEGAAIYYTTNGDEPTSSSTLYEGAFNITEACTVKAIAIKATYDNSSVASKAFAKVTVLTIAEAIALIPNKDDVVNNQYVRGLVSQAATSVSSGQMTYYISADGLTSSQQFQIYKGKNIGNADFTSVDEITLGDAVIVYGQLKNFNNTYEMNSGNYLIERTAAVLQSVAVSGTPDIVKYGEGQEFDPTGLVVTATYNTGYAPVVTEDIEWNATPSTITASGNVSVTATWGGKTSAAYEVAVTLAEQAPSFSPAAGEYLEAQEIALTAATGAAIYYTLDGTEPTSASTAYENPISLSERGTTTIKALAIGENGESQVVSAIYNINLPYSILEAIALIPEAGNSRDNTCVDGVIYRVQNYNSTSKCITYWITANGLKQDSMQVYKGKGIGGADFASIDDLVVGDAVRVYGQLLNYNGKYEMNEGNHLISYTAKTLEAVTVDGAATKTEYAKGEDFEFAGLTARATYDTYYMAEIPFDEVTWHATPAKVTEEGIVNVTATWNEVTSDALEVSVAMKEYAVTFSNPANGSIVVKNNGVAIESGATFKEGTVLTVETTADDYYRLATLTANEADIKSAGQFEVGAAAVVVAATFEAQPVQLMGDLGSAGWGDGILFSETTSAETRTLALTGITAGTYAFKLKVNGEWRSNAYEYNRGFQGANDITGNEQGDMKLVADKDGDYTLTWMFGNNSLAFEFPHRDYTLVGVSALTGGYNWGDGMNVEANLLGYVEGGLYRLVKEDLLLAAGTYAYQIARDHDWRGVSNSELSIDKSGRYNVTFTFNENGGVTNAVAELIEEVVILPTIQAAGEWNVDGESHWIYNDFEPASNKLTATYTATIAAGDYKFKILNNSNWLGNGANITRAANSAVLTENGDDMVLKADASGEYTFTWTYETDKLEITFPQKEAGLSWSAAAATAYTVGKEYELPTLSNPNNLENVSYESSVPGVATIAANGEIALVGAGSTVIKATSEATSVYKAGEATYTLTVLAPASVAVTGEAEKDAYEAGETFSFAGLGAKAVYAENDEYTIPANEITWTPAEAPVINANGNVEVKATWQGLTSAVKNIAVAVNTHKVTIAAVENGTLVVKNGGVAIESGAEFAKGTELTVEASANAGYKLTALTAGEENILESKQFTVGTTAVTVAATFTAKAAAGLSWSAATATAYTVGKSYTLPTLSNPNNLENVSYESSVPGVATIAANGEIALVDAGSTVIKATSAETAEYAAGEASYTLTVLAPASVVVTGEAEKDAYEAGETFSFAGLGAKAVYAENDEYAIPANDIVWTNSLTDNKVNAAGDVTVTAEWQSLSGNKVVGVTLLSHELTFNTPTNGTLVVEYNDEAVETGEHFLKGDVLTITATPASIDYKLASLTVNGADFVSGSTYTVGTEDIAIVASFTKKPEPTLSWSIDPNNPKNVYLSGRDEDNEFPTAINPQDLPLTYGSLNGSVAEIDAEGNFILHEAGFASMYFNFAGNEAYCSVHREYPLTVYALDRIEIGGEATATEYEAGDAFGRSGLTATAVYKVGDFTENYDVTTKATWNATPATIAANTAKVSVTAAWNSKTSAAEEVAVTVKTHKVIFDANKNHVYLSVWNGETQISSGDEFAKGTVLTVEVELESADYVLATLTANTTDIKATKQFTIGEVDVTIEATSESKPLAPISWSAESASIAMNGDVATLPTLVNELGLGIKYMNNNEEAATIDENTGVITLVGPGEATILAVYVATPESQYRTTLAEYTLTVTAVTYAVTFEAPTNGSLEILNGEDAVASGAEFVAGTELTITATADQGYKLSSLTVNGEDFVSGETYTMGAQAVVVVATFVQDSGTTIDNAEAGEKAQKIMLNNQLFILRGGKMYDAQGKLVK